MIVLFIIFKGARVQKSETCKHEYERFSNEYQATNPPRYAYKCRVCGKCSWIAKSYEEYKMVVKDYT